MTQGEQATSQRTADDANRASRDSTDHPETSTYAAIDEGGPRSSGDDDEPAGEAAPPPDERDARHHASEGASDPTDDPNMSTEGVLDEEELRAHAREVDNAIQEARRRNG